MQIMLRWLRQIYFEKLNILITILKNYFLNFSEYNYKIIFYFIIIMIIFYIY